MSQCLKVPKTFGYFDQKQQTLVDPQPKAQPSLFQPISILENDLSNNLNSNRLQLPLSNGYSNFLNYNPYNTLDHILHQDNDGYSNYDYDQKQKSQNVQQQYLNLLTNNFNSNLNVHEELSNNLFELRNLNKDQIDILQSNSRAQIFKEEVQKEDKILQEFKKQVVLDVPCQKDVFSLSQIKALSKKTFNNKELYQEIIPLLGILEEEPRYVNSRQYNRMMIMRIKRAKKATMLQKAQNEKSNQQLQQQLSKNNSRSHNLEDSNQANSETSSNKTYKYESRHKHAMNRQRGPDGRFKSQNKSNSVSKQSRKIGKQMQIKQETSCQEKKNDQF